jgi:hypothetical protein
MQSQLNDLDEFDQLLVSTIREVLEESLGKENAQIVFEYLERRSCSLKEIPKKLDVFSIEMRRLLGCCEGQFLGSAAVLEEAIAKIMCFKLGVEFNERLPIVFPNYTKKLRGVCSERKTKSK